MAFSATDTRLLKRIEELFRQIDALTRGTGSGAPARTAESGALQYPEELLFQLRGLIAELEHSGHPDLRRCARLADHLVPGMSRRHFLNQWIPFERALGRDLKDSDFLVTEADAREPASVLESRPLTLVLENLRSAFNVGSILRLADGLGCREVILTGYTPGLENKAVLKTAMGAFDSARVRAVEATEVAIAELRAQGAQIVGLETARTATPVFEFRFRQPTALIVGNERFGLDTKTLAACDHLVVLPLAGMKNSLNVATALSAVAFEWTRQHFTNTPQKEPADVPI